jgi:hypothetical protein
MSSKRGRKRKAKIIESMSNSTSAIINQSSGMTSVQEKNVVPLHPIVEELTEEKKSRKTKPRRFIPPCVAPERSEQGVRQLQVSSKHSQESLKSAETSMVKTSRVVVPSVIDLDPNRSSNTTKPNVEASNFEPVQNLREQNIVPVSTADRLQMAESLISLVPGGSNFTSRVQELSETNACTEARTQCSSEAYEGDLLLNYSCSGPENKPQNFTVVGKESSERCLEISGYEYVPSSNPNSPQIAPTEGTKFTTFTLSSKAKCIHALYEAYLV